MEVVLITSILILTNTEDFDFMLQFLLGVVGGPVSNALTSCYVRLHGPTEVKARWPPNPTASLSESSTVHWHRPGRIYPISNSLLDLFSRGAPTDPYSLLPACRQSGIFTPEHIFSPLTATRASLLQRRCPVSEGRGWKARAWGDLSLLFVCKNFQSWQMQTDRYLTCLFMEVAHDRYAA